MDLLDNIESDTLLSIDENFKLDIYIVELYGLESIVQRFVEAFFGQTIYQTLLSYNQPTPVDSIVKEAKS
jgi:hypothetical protein